MLQNYWCSILCAFTIIGLLVRTTHAQTPKKEEKIRAYEFGFTIDEQQHRHEKRDERGIVMGEFGFITADGIYHVTVYATDEEGKFRILAMRNYPYESPPKTVDMIVKPKPATAATTRAPPTTISTTTLQAIIEKKVLPKFNFNTQGCAGCFIKNGTPKDTPNVAGDEGKQTKTPIRPLSQLIPLTPVRSPNTIATSTAGGNVGIFNSKLPQVYAGQIVTTANSNKIPLVFETTINTLDFDSETPIHITPIVPYNANVAASTISEVKNTATRAKTPPSYSPTPIKIKDTTFLPITHRVTTLGNIPTGSKTQTTSPLTPTRSVTNELNKLVPGNEAIQTQTNTPTQSHTPATNEYSTNLLPTEAATQTKSPTKLSAIRYTNTPLTPGVKNINSHTITNSPATLLSRNISPTLAGTNIPTVRIQTTTPTQTFTRPQPSTRTPTPDGSLKTAPTFATAAAQSRNPTIATTPKRYTITPTFAASQEETPTAASFSPAGAGVSYTTPSIYKSPTTHLNSRNAPTIQTKTPTLTQSTKTGKPGSSLNTQSQNTPTIQSQIPSTRSAGAGVSPQSNAQNPTAASAVNSAKPTIGGGGAQQQPTTGGAANKPGSGYGGNTSGVGGIGGSRNSGPTGSFGGTGGTGSKTVSGEPGDLYRFKYILDYNGHTETGSRNGNKEGNYFAVGDDNVERTIEYVANELGYQPRIRFRKLDAPVPSKENTLKEYEFVWFKE